MENINKNTLDPLLFDLKGSTYNRKAKENSLVLKDLD